jgi:rhodanese-related sulfurtransferase
MKIKEGCGQRRLFWGLSLGVLAWLVAGAGSVKAMTPMNNQHREEAIRQLYLNYKKCFPEVPEVSPQEAMKLVQEGQAVLVDVRPAAERAVSRLPGAISKTEFLNSRESYAGKTIIAYDTIGYRSGLFVEALRKKGRDIANLQEGLLGWLRAGGKIYDDHGETRRVHIYGPMWNYAPANCEAVR